MSKVSTYIDVSWGKFRGWQRVQPASERLTKPQLRAAWSVWDLMRKAEQAEVLQQDDWAEQICQQTLQLAKEMPEELRRGPVVFSRYLVDHRATLEQALVRTVAETSHTTDKVTAQIIR